MTLDTGVIADLLDFDDALHGRTRDAVRRWENKANSSNGDERLLGDLAISGGVPGYTRGVHVVGFRR
ncbi:hypothetical protein [Streptosporangium sp. H16]|uniref:hypothetical protein n=1 Tax=Streptosporangium sp. H16 TaxID=3444184 RepID=UPI003F7B188E